MLIPWRWSYHFVQNWMTFSDTFACTADLIFPNLSQVADCPLFYRCTFTSAKLNSSNFFNCMQFKFSKLSHNFQLESKNQHCNQGGHGLSHYKYLCASWLLSMIICFQVCMNKQLATSCKLFMMVVVNYSFVHILYFRCQRRGWNERAERYLC